MARFPDLGSWFMRSVRRDHFASTPVLAVERLNTLPRPIQDADKEVLVGAVLTMSSSLHLALSMLRELLPHEKSQERLAEVVCPTLNHLLAALQNTLSSFERRDSPSTPSVPASCSAKATQQSHARALHANTALKPAPEPKRPGIASDEQPVQVRRHGDDRSCSSCGSANTERLLPLQDNDQSRQLHIEVSSHNRPETHLVKALQAEMRVQAAIHVAIESLEFAEGQLKVVKEVNQLHGGELDILQTHFYEGYNRLLFRALELQRRELGLLQDRDSLILDSALQQRHQQPTEDGVLQTSPKQHQSVSFQKPLPLCRSASTLRSTAAVQGASWERRVPGRRNTIQGIRQEGARARDSRPPLRRRLSLAEELALAGDDSESGYQEETSERASSGSEHSDAEESSNGARGLMINRNESEESDRNAESGGEESALDSSDDDGQGDDDGEETLIPAIASLGGGSSYSKSRWPRLQQRR
ncbi:uncharacterized protein THITE_2106066 [Thermothielavioides terrestris NRRL 8126]|uniref:Uncharacterized protein n=1 Tax=Thermothielavioides terrestris (strain ATCC 38088 / NRRL 8126) TaxID=578455 RepID=G2QW13_THETT|nr:uncharacterized protein THITE_2106066 [Thermothielavioides terrestris NRRL 8126]AEO62184.1 hypothetical protein THITE_2106066 [Thermothielavioides terrestris NRRL 8126]